MPFAMQLPNDLPSSFSGYDTYVQYSMYSNIDISWQRDPSTRTFFTVVQPHVVASMMAPQRALQSSTVYPQLCIPPFCCCCSVPLVCVGAYGDVTFNVSTDRRAYAPGEFIRLGVKLESTWSEAAANIIGVTVTLILKYHKWCRGGVTETHTNNLIQEQLSDLTVGTEVFANLRVPSTPPTYLGGIDYSDWYKSVNGYGQRWGTVTRDPVIWGYEVIVAAEMKVPGITCVNKTYTATIPVIIGAIGLAIQPPFTDSAYWEAQELAQAPRAVLHEGASFGAPPLPWQTAGNVQVSLEKLGHLTPVASGPAMSFAHPEEDHNTPASQTSYAPCYFVCPTTDAHVSDVAVVQPILR